MDEFFRKIEAEMCKDGLLAKPAPRVDGRDVFNKLARTFAGPVAGVLAVGLMGLAVLRKENAPKL